MSIFFINVKRKLLLWAKMAGRLVMDMLSPKDMDVERLERMNLCDFVISASDYPRPKDTKEAIYLFPYRSPVVKTALVEAKSFKNTAIISLLGDLLYDCLLPELADLTLFKNFSFPMIVPIPMTAKKKKERGFNQCEMILRSFSDKDKQKIFEINTEALIKIRETDDQVGKSKEERVINQNGCLTVKNKALVRERNIFVLDDILTTGATLKEAKRALLEAGARNVVCVAIGH